MEYFQVKVSAEYGIFASKLPVIKLRLGGEEAKFKLCPFEGMFIFSCLLY